MKRITPVYLFVLLLVSWFLINILQAMFMEITNDEAYYALWGKALDWGYFDHPPMVALFTYVGSLLFSGNLGVRFVTVVVQLATLVVLWKTIEFKTVSKDHVVRFFAFAASIVMFAVYGFIVAPDAPLLFFAACFLWAYRLFLKKESLLYAVLLGLSMAGMIYSKYHAGLLILLVVLSNPKLLSNYRFWLSVACSLILLIPHIYWQVQHEFPGFQYHLIDRSEGFKWQYFFRYWPNQLAVFNPFTFVAVCWVFFGKHKITLFDRALYFIIVGFLIFFWGTSFRGHVEPHWTILASLPMMILVLREAEVNPKLERYIRHFVYPSLLLILTARILLVTELLPRQFTFYGKEAKNKALQEIAGDYPVIFKGAFRGPSLYQYFTGKEAMPISTLYSRKTQFDIWKAEERFYDKTVFVLGHYDGRSSLFEKNGYQFEGFLTDSLQVTNHIVISYQLRNTIFKPGDSIVLPITIRNHAAQAYRIDHAVFPGQLTGLFVTREELLEVPAEGVVNSPILSGETIKTTVRLSVPQSVPATCKFTISLKSWFGPTLNAPLTTIKIQQP